ncbi:zinc transporter 6 isoform X2 [Osmerus mordax]|uniref:zinc transporter 6 isoform X2 n=1 Tax=Osmerus mordax TaxID=8014 RepID=UPI00350EC7C4
MVAVDVINIKDSDIPLHRKKQEHDTYVLGTIHPFRKTHRSLFGKLLQEFRLVTSDRRSWRILLFGVLNVLCTGCLLVWCSSTNSMALTAYTYLTIFDLFSLITCLTSSWVSMKKPSQLYSFGFERLEVVAVFASTVLVQLGALFILKESLCGVIPGLSSILLPRMNPFVLINVAGALSLCITYMLIEINNYNAVDTASAVAIALMTFGTMYPMSVYSGKVLLQTTPSHVIGQLDKLLREVSTLDGVLEVRNEHFWTVGFGSLAGSVHVRIRRDANEQMVLAHVTNRLLPLVSTLTVQIFKDDWIRPSLVTGALPTTSALGPSEYGGPAGYAPPHPSSTRPQDELDPLTSTPSKPSSPPPEFSFDTPGRHVQPVVLPGAQQHLRPGYNLGINYGASPYTSMLNPGLTRPGGGLGLGVGTGMGLGMGMGTGMPSSQSFRTALSSAPHSYGTNPNLLPSQYSQYKP